MSLNALNARGFVSLVGAGPGDPKLLTLRGREVLEAADVVFYDALIGEEILKWVRPDAGVGKVLRA